MDEVPFMGDTMLAEHYDHHQPIRSEDVTYWIRQHSSYSNWKRNRHDKKCDSNVSMNEDADFDMAQGKCRWQELYWLACSCSGCSSAAICNVIATLALRKVSIEVDGTRPTVVLIYSAYYKATYTVLQGILSCKLNPTKERIQLVPEFGWLLQPWRVFL